MDFERMFTTLQYILDLCGCQVAVSPDSTKVSLVHYSIEVFHVSDWTRDSYAPLSIGSPEVDAGLANTSITSRCLENFSDVLNCVDIGAI